MKFAVSLVAIAALAAAGAGTAIAQAALPDSPGAQVPAKVESTGPTAVCVQSLARIRVAISPSPAKQSYICNRLFCLSKGRLIPISIRGSARVANPAVDAIHLQ